MDRPDAAWLQIGGARDIIDGDLPGRGGHDQHRGGRALLGLRRTASVLSRPRRPAPRRASGCGLRRIPPRHRRVSPPGLRQGRGGASPGWHLARGHARAAGASAGLRLQLGPRLARGAAIHPRRRGDGDQHRVPDSRPAGGSRSHRAAVADPRLCANAARDPGRYRKSRGVGCGSASKGDPCHSRCRCMEMQRKALRARGPDWRR